MTEGNLYHLKDILTNKSMHGTYAWNWGYIHAIPCYTIFTTLPMDSDGLA